MSAARLHVAIDVTAIPDRPVGAGRYVLELTRALADRDDVALTLITRRGDEARWRIEQRTSALGVAPESLPGRLAFGEIALGRVVARRVAPEVLHGPHYTLPARSAIPGVITVHDLTLWDRPEWHERSKVLFFRRALRLATRRAQVIVVPSQHAAEAFREHFGDAVPVLAIPHGVDHHRFVAFEASPGADREILTGHGIEWPYVLSVATSEPRKNLAALVKAFAKLASAERDLRLVLVGRSGWKNAELDHAIATSQVEDRIVRLGYLSDDDLPALIRSARVVAYPAFVEGFGLPVLEALACGAPVVTSAASAMAEVTGDSALLVDPGDVDAVAAALESALVGGPEGSRRRRDGLERAERYTWSASAALHVEAYRLAIVRASQRAGRGPA